MRRRLPRRACWLSTTLIAVTLAAGLALRKVPLGLPPGVVKHGGSVLWALMIYWIVSTLRPAWRPRHSAVVAAAVTSATELSQLLHEPSLDAFRRTGIGALLLGRVFSVPDLVTYAIAVVAGASIDRLIRHR